MSIKENNEKIMSTVATTGDKRLKLLELFGGIGAPRKALENIGYDIKSLDYVEILPYAVLAYNSIFDIRMKPQDILTWNMDVDVLVHGSPCFTGDTLVLTDQGYKEIKDVKPGDMVLTHMNRYRKVLNFFDNGEKEIYEVHTSNAEVLRTTANHRLYVRKKAMTYPRREDGGRTTRRAFGDPEWKAVSELTGGAEYFIGYAINQNSAAPEWPGVECHRGHDEQNKFIPPFAFDMPDEHISALLSGYFDAYGSFSDDNKIRSFGTGSRKLAYGIGQLVAKAYKVPFSIYKISHAENKETEGRTARQRGYYEVRFRLKTASDAFYENGYLWYPVDKVLKTGETENVYDIEVDEDHSFTANGCIAHNCQDWSKAGNNNINTGRSILYERVLQILDPARHELAHLPKLVLWENVPQLVYKFGDHFNHYLDTMSSYGYTNYWKILKASDYGIPQARERVYTVSVLGDMPYEFPAPVPLLSTVSDYLDKTVDPEDYKLTEKELEIVFDLPEGRKAVKEATKLGYKEFEDGDVINFEFPSSKTRRGRVGKGIAKTFTTGSRQAVYTGGHLRLFTAKEQLMLMGFSEKDYRYMVKNGLTDQQICQLAGNSICVPVLEQIFKQAAAYRIIPEAK